MGLFDGILSTLQDSFQGAIPDPQEIIDSTLANTSVDETVQQVMESPQDAIQNGITDVLNQQ